MIIHLLGRRYYFHLTKHVTIISLDGCNKKILRKKTKQTKLVFFQCYFPTSSSSIDDVNILYDQIEAEIKRIPLRDHLFIMGDFNAKLGGLHTNYPTSIGKHTIGEYNERGELLAKFCARNKLVVTNLSQFSA